jgi:hypothetical protein
MKKFILFLALFTGLHPLTPRETFATVTETAGRDDHNGNGTTTVFTYTFRILDQAHIRVLLNGVVQTLTTHYSVGSVGSATGSITFVTAPTNGSKVTFLRDQPLAQPNQYLAGTGISNPRLESDLDRGAMVDQMQQEQLDRSFHYAETQIPTAALTTIPTPVASKCIGFDGAATSLALNDCGGSGGGGSSFTTSAGLAGILTDETGTGAAVFAGSPTLTGTLTVPRIDLTTCQELTGSGSPEGVVAAPVCSTYRRTDGGASTTFYAKETGAATSTGWVPHGNPAGSGAPTTVPFITTVADGGVSAEFALGSLATGLLKNTTTTGIPTIAVVGTDYLSPASVLANSNLPTTITGRTLDNTNTITGWDTLFTLQDNADPTKQMKFELSGYTTATTFTLTPPAANTHLLGGSHFAGTANGGMERTGTGTYAIIKHNRAATVNPTTTDDTSAGYAIGSEWINTTASPRTVWKASDVTASAAVWVQSGVASVPTLTAVLAAGRTDTTATSFATAVRFGGWAFYDDVSLGPIFAPVCSGVENDCDYKRKHAAGKVDQLLNSSGVSKFTWTESTGALTDIIMDAEGSNNVITIPYEEWFEVAGCNNVTASLIFNSNTANAPAATCEGTNTRLATADFDDTTDEGFTFSKRLPTGFTGAIDFIFRGKMAVTSGAVGICAQLVRVPTGATSDPSLPAQAAGNCTSTTVAGTTLQEFESTISGATCTSCAAGDRLNIRVSRDANGGAVTDSATGDYKMLGFTMRYRRAL